MLSGLHGRRRGIEGQGFVTFVYNPLKMASFFAINSKYGRRRRKSEAPRAHLTRCHGVLGPAVAWRSLIVPTENDKGRETEVKPQPAAQQSAVPTVEAEPCAEFSVRGRNYTWEPAPQKLIYCESGRIGPYFPDFSANRTTMHLQIEKIRPRFPTFSLRSFLPRRLLGGVDETRLSGGRSSV